MHDIDGIEEAFAELKPHWNKIEEKFNIENQKLLKLISTDHDNLGEILKFHLIIENYLNNFLIGWFQFNEIDNLKLSFIQKALMIPDESHASFVKSSIIELNKIRNKFAHEISTVTDNLNIREIEKVLEIARKDIFYPNNITKIKAFIPIACAFLLPSSTELDFLINNVFKKIKILNRTMD